MKEDLKAFACAIGIVTLLLVVIFIFIFLGKSIDEYFINKEFERCQIEIKFCEIKK